MKIKKVVIFFFLLSFLLGCNCKRTEIIQKRKTYDVIIIGAGLGGLNAASVLSHLGKKVLLLEKNNHLGGCAGSFSKNGFHFEKSLASLCGPLNVFLKPISKIKYQIVNENDPVKNKNILTFIKLKNLYRTVVSVNGKKQSFKFPADIKQAKKKLNQAFPHSVNSIRKFFKILKEPFSVIIPKYNKISTDQLFKKLKINDPYLKLILSQYWVYLGLPSNSLSATALLTCLKSYLTYGAYQILNSSQTLVKAYKKSILNGKGTIICGEYVKKIIVKNGDNNKYVEGVISKNIKNGKIHKYYSDNIIADLDPFQLFFYPGKTKKNGLIGRKNTPIYIQKILSNLKPTAGLVQIYLGLDIGFNRYRSHKWLQNFEIIYSKNMNSNTIYKNILEGNYKSGSISMESYSSLPKCFSKFYSKDNKSILTISTLTNSDNWKYAFGTKGYKNDVKKIKKKLIDMAEDLYPKLREHILFAEIIDPTSINNHTKQYKGVVFGAKNTIEVNNKLNLSFKIKGIRGLYVVGAWTLGGGYSPVQVSGLRTAFLVKGCQNEKF